MQILSNASRILAYLDSQVTEKRQKYLAESLMCSIGLEYISAVVLPDIHLMGLMTLLVKGLVGFSSLEIPPIW